MDSPTWNVHGRDQTESHGSPDTCIDPRLLRVQILDVFPPLGGQYTTTYTTFTGRAVPVSGFLFGFVPM